MKYLFTSFCDAKTGENIGACMVGVAVNDHDSTEEIMEACWEKCRSLGIYPDANGSRTVAGMTAEVTDHKLESLELDRLYSPSEMDEMGYETSPIIDPSGDGSYEFDGYEGYNLNDEYDDIFGD